MITLGRGIQHQLRSVGDLGPASQHSRVVARGVRIPGHHRDVTRRAAGVDPGAGPVGDLPQDRGDPLVGEAEPDPGQVPVQQPGQHQRQLARVRPPVLRGRKHHRVGPVVLAVREQHRQLGLAEHVPGPPPVKPQLVLPGGEPGGERVRAYAHPRVHDPRVVVGGHHRLERAPADQLLHRRPGPARLLIDAGPQHLPQHLPVARHAELLAEDLHDLLRALQRQGPARRRLPLPHPPGGRVHQLPDQPGPQRVQRRRHPRPEERHRRTRAQVLAQRR